MSSPTIARWLKETLKEAGIDTAIFKAHSCRGAAASAAKNVGVAVTDIMKTADWSRETTFTHYYYRSNKENQLDKAVLEQRKVCTCEHVQSWHCFEHTLLYAKPVVLWNWKSYQGHRPASGTIITDSSRIVVI